LVAGRTRRVQPLPVAGLITALTGVIRFAGKPDLSACSRMSSSLGAL
jgi:hypothetical protein